MRESSLQNSLFCSLPHGTMRILGRMKEILYVLQSLRAQPTPLYEVALGISQQELCGAPCKQELFIPTPQSL